MKAFFGDLWRDLKREWEREGREHPTLSRFWLIWFPIIFGLGAIFAVLSRW